MAIRMFTSEALEVLKTNVQLNEEKYRQSAPWVETYLSENMLNIESGGNKGWYVTRDVDLELGNIHLGHLSENGEAIEDLKNVKQLYSPLVSLPMDIATDERFWAYLTHIQFREYMQDRAGNHDILENYFFKASSSEGDRSLFRNALARLWWFGHMTYDSNLENPYELTEFIMQLVDFAQQLGERSYSRNPMITRTILTVLKNEIQFSPRGNRQGYRDGFKHINRIGGVKVLDFLDEEDIRDIVIKGFAS